MDVFRRRATDAKCDASNCPTQDYVEQVLGDFTKIADKLTEGQVQMQVHLARLTESLSGIKRLDDDLGKLEDKVDQNSQMLWKVVGGVSVIALVAPIIVGNFF